CMAPAALAPGLLGSTVEVAALIAGGKAAPAAAVSAKVAALTEGVLKTMLLSRLNVAVVVMLVLGGLGIGANSLPYRPVAAEPPHPKAKSAVFSQDQANLKETVLALEKRMWEAHTTQDIDAVKALLADDYVGRDTRGGTETKASNLAWMANFRAGDPEMKNTKGVLLHTTSAIVTYEVHYKIVSPGGKLLQIVPPRQVTSAWAQRDGKWWCVYAEASVLGNDGIRSKVTRTDDTWETTQLIELWKGPREDRRP